VVFKLTSEGPRWVFPKAHVEHGETGATAALRELFLGG
jgi:8-oxo-dGTP pyrophosphatase MutT (NUDIX family)